MPHMIKCIKQIRTEQRGATILFSFLLNLVAPIFIWYLVLEVVKKTKVGASDQTVMDLGQLYLIGSDWFPLSLSTHFPVESDLAGSEDWSDAIASGIW